ncbi:hypothetical protein [Bacteroides sp.]
MDIADIYVKTFEKASGLNHPVWPPTERIHVGDYGTYKNGCFDKMGNIKKLGILFATDKSEQPGIISQSEGVDYEFNPNLNINAAYPAKASLSVKIDKKRTAFIHFISTEAIVIKDLASVEDQIMRKFRSKTWRRDWIVITEVAHSNNFVTVISQDGQSSVAFNCETDLPDLTFESASLKFAVSRNQNSSYYCSTGSDIQQCTPMFKARKIKGYLKPEFQPIQMDMCYDSAFLSEESPKKRRIGQLYNEDMDYQFEDL